MLSIKIINGKLKCFHCEYSIYEFWYSNNCNNNYKLLIVSEVMIIKKLDRNNKNANYIQYNWENGLKF